MRINILTIITVLIKKTGLSPIYSESLSFSYTLLKYKKTPSLMMVL